MSNLKWLLRTAQNVTIYNVILGNLQGKITLQMVGKEGVLLSSIPNTFSLSPTWSVAGLIAHQLPDELLNEEFMVRIISNNNILLERQVHLKNYCQFFGDASQLSFPPFAISFDFGDHILMDRQLADLLGLSHGISFPKLHDEDPLSLYCSSELAGSKNRILENARKLKYIDHKSLRNNKITILNQMRNSLNSLECESDLLHSAIFSANVVLDNMKRSIEESNGQYEIIEKYSSSLYRKHTEKTQKVIKSKFLLEARQVKLLGEIQLLFPISRLDNGEYAIRSLELNNDVTNSKDEDLVASALGFVVHVVLLVSKYLEVPLRYQLLFMGSRSLIRDAVGVSSTSAYPLFKRGVEKDRFEKALSWLRTDIEQLLSTRGVVYDSSQSLLYNLAQLFESEKCPKLAF